MTSVRRMTALVALASAAATPTVAADPRLAPGRDPGGTAVAILADGFDYTKPELAAVLARDGEGEAIAWDAIDADGLPYAKEAHGTADALSATSRGNVRIVQVRVDWKDPSSAASGIAFAVQTPATILLATSPASEGKGHEVLTAAARKFENVLFVAAHGRETTADEKPEDGPANLLLLTPEPNGFSPADAVAHALGCGQDALQGTSGADLKAAFLDRLKRPPPAACPAPVDRKPDKP